MRSSRHKEARNMFFCTCCRIVCIFVYLCSCLIHACIRAYTYSPSFSINPCVCLSIYLFIYPTTYLSICLSIFPSIYLNLSIDMYRFVDGFLSSCTHIGTVEMSNVYNRRTLHICMMQGCCTPPAPPTPWYPLPVKGLAPSSWVVLFGLVPSPPCGVGPVVFLVGPAPPVGGSVFYRGMVWLLPLVSSNVIVTCFLPSPLWGGACGRFGWPRPACVGQCVLQRYGMVAAAR